MTNAQPLRRSDALRVGLGDDGLRRDVHSGALLRATRGVYCAPSDELDAHGRHRIAALGVLQRFGADAALSHVSAAVVLGLPTYGLDLTRVHVTRPGVTGGARTRSTVVHRVALEPTDVGEVDGIRVTSPVRTVVDVACSTTSLQAALVTADAAAGRFRVGGDELAAALARRGGARGIGFARRVAQSLDPRSESPGESRSRAIMLEHLLPVPDLQVVIEDETTALRARVDFLWREHGVIGEFDGAVKYRGRLAGGDPESVLLYEKRRQEALEALGFVVVRWGWPELDEPNRLTKRIERVLERNSQGIQKSTRSSES